MSIYSLSDILSSEGSSRFVGRMFPCSGLSTDVMPAFVSIEMYLWNLCVRIVTRMTSLSSLLVLRAQ